MAGLCYMMSHQWFNGIVSCQQCQSESWLIMFTRMASFSLEVIILA
jgi:hypothetical protein